MGTEAPSKPRGRRRLVAIIVIVLITLIAAEGIVRARADVLPPRKTWANPEMQAKEIVLSGHPARDARSVFFLGSSAVDVAVDPSRMHNPPGSRVRYNAAAMGATLRVMSTWAKKIVVPRWHPDVVVLGVTSRELNGGREQNGIDANFFDAPAVRELLGAESFLERAERHLEDVSALFKYRTVLREQKAVAALLGLASYARDPVAEGEVFAPDGQVRAFLHRPYRLKSTTRTFFAKQMLGDFHIGELQRATLRDLLVYLTPRTKNVVVLDMPVTDDYVGFHPRGRTDYEEYERVIRDEVRRAGATYIDGGIWPRTYFADPAHLNERGSIRVTALIDRALAKL